MARRAPASRTTDAVAPGQSPPTTLTCRYEICNIGTTAGALEDFHLFVGYDPGTTAGTVANFVTFTES